MSDPTSAPPAAVTAPAVRSSPADHLWLLLSPQTAREWIFTLGHLACIGLAVYAAYKGEWKEVGLLLGMVGLIRFDPPTPGPRQGGGPGSAASGAASPLVPVGLGLLLGTPGRWACA